MSSHNASHLPAYQRIKNDITDRIHEGLWRGGDAIPAEIALAEEFGVSRMTVNRALKELAEAGVLERRQGSGTFVAQQQFNHTFVEVRNIAEDIQRAGKCYQAKVVKQGFVDFSELPNTAQKRFKSHQPIYQVDILHLADNLPIQYERRWVDCAMLPDFAKQDFGCINTSSYLIEQVPLVRGNYIIKATTPPADIARLLHITPLTDEHYCPALLLSRHTYSGDDVVTYVQMWHDGDTYQFSDEL